MQIGEISFTLSCLCHMFSIKAKWAIQSKVIFDLILTENKRTLLSMVRLGFCHIYHNHYIRGCNNLISSNKARSIPYCEELFTFYLVIGLPENICMMILYKVKRNYEVLVQIHKPAWIAAASLQFWSREGTDLIDTKMILFPKGKS